MTPDDPIGGDRNPEDGAITGGAPPAAEPPPQTRDRRGSIVAPVWIYALAGLALLVTALVADQESSRAIGTAIAGAVLLAIAGLSIAGVVHSLERAGVGIALAAALTVLAFAVSQPGLARGVYLACAAALLIAGFATLAAAGRPARGEGEPGPGVRNV
jgi:hypothetical protein